MAQVSTYINYWIMFLIICSAIVAVVETIPSIHKSQEDLWFGLESTFVFFFTIEFVCRAISCPDKLEFLKTIMNYIDLLAILPYYVDLIGRFASEGGASPNFGFLRILRLSRAARLIKLSKYSQGIRLVTNAMANSIDALQLFALLLTLVLVVFSSGIYYTERGDWVNRCSTSTMCAIQASGQVECWCPNERKKDEGCPNEWYEQFGGAFNATGNGLYANKCIVDRYYRQNTLVGGSGKIEQYPSPFQSIPQSFWWCIVTLTTVGYGDMYPYSPEGKVVGVFTMLVGLIMLALPLSIIGTNFIEERNIMVNENKQRLEDQRKDEVGITEAQKEAEKPKFNMRKDLREVLAKADQLYDSTGLMAQKLERAAVLLREMKAFKLAGSGSDTVISPVVDTQENAAPPTEGKSEGSAEGVGKGSGSGESSGDVALEMQPMGLGVVGNQQHTSLYVVPVSQMEELKELCLGVLRTAIQEMKIWDPQGELPEMPAQILQLLQSESKENKECLEIWKERLAAYEEVSTSGDAQEDDRMGAALAECAPPSRMGC